MQVHAAADAIVSAGERPTIERIRAELGTGSPNTVTRHLDGWWSALGSRLAALDPRVAIPEAPEPVQRLAGELWGQAVAAAREEAEAALAGEREALANERAVLASAHAENIERLGVASRAREAAERAQALAEGRLTEALRRADQLEAQLADVAEQRVALAKRIEQLEQEREALAGQLRTEQSSAAQEREAVSAHARAVEDRAYAEVDRLRQEALDLRGQLRAIALERNHHRDALEKSLKKATAESSRIHRELAEQTGRAETLDAQLRAVRALQPAGRAPNPRKAKKQPPRAKRKDSGS